MVTKFVFPDCGNLAVRYASVTYPVGKAYKGVALVTCLQGYQLIGHGVAICQNNGSWSETPTCEAVCKKIYNSLIEL